MRKDGRRSSHQVVVAQSLQSVQSPAVQAERGAAAALLDADVNAVPGVAQKRHSGAEMFGLSRGPSVGLCTTGSRAPTDIEFQARLVPPTSFVITRLAPSGLLVVASREGDAARTASPWFQQAVRNLHLSGTLGSLQTASR